MAVKALAGLTQWDLITGHNGSISLFIRAIPDEKFS